MTIDIDHLRRLLPSLPLSTEWCYGAIRHVCRNVDDMCFISTDGAEYQKIEGGELHTLDRYDGTKVAELLNQLPALLDELAALREENARLARDHEAMEVLRTMLAKAGKEDSVELMGYNNPREWVLHWWDAGSNGWAFTNSHCETGTGDPADAILAAKESEASE